jgi:hypothetical protein
VHFRLGVMERRRLGFKKVDLQDSIDPVGEVLEETINDKDGVVK